MAQRYFITAESTYEDLRQSLNAQLSYPNALGKTVFQTALQAPRDGFRRVLLAVDTDLANYAAIAASIAPLTDSDAMEEIDEATYLDAVSSATAGASAWNDITGKPSAFTPAAHKTSHATGGTDALTPADIGASAVGHAHSVSDITATGTPSATTFLRGDGSWATPSGGAVSVRSDTVGSTSYIGRAASGSATSASVWTIRRTILTSAGAVSSTATATNVAWDNRLTATYS